MFRLYCTRVGSNEPVILKYDAKKSLIFDEDGTNLGEKLKEQFLQVQQAKIESGEISPDSNFKQNSLDPIPAVKFSPENPIGKTSNVRKLKIQLGLKCNYSCSYCSQASHLNQTFDTGNDDALEFLDKLDSWLTSVPQNIEFWGGEPFVYWKKLKILVPELRKKFPETTFSIITNGSLMTDEIISFIIENDIMITISHDGPGQPLRGPDPLEDPVLKEQWLKLFSLREGKVGINAVLTARNNKISKIRNWFYEKLEGDKVFIGLEGVVNAHDDGINTKFNEEDYIEMQSDIFFSLWNGEEPMGSPLMMKAKGFLDSILYQSDSEYLWQKCGMDRPEELAVDLKGNALTCQNTGNVGKHNIGSVYDMENVKLDTSWHWTEREECSHCPVLQICQGSCMFLEGDEWAQTCENEFNYAKPILAFVLARFFGFILLDIKGDIRRPKLKERVFPRIPISEYNNL
jgi:uncharacterized protein